MKTVAIYNMKGGVGKTTTAVNLSYLAAAAGKRTLLWDLDPQAASSFAFRVRAHVSGFGKKSLENGHALDAAIKETDYTNLHLLPADFAYRKFERFLSSLGKPERLLTTLLETLGRDFDVVLLDCPAGFSLLTEGIFAAADAVLVPTIPTVLSLRTVARADQVGRPLRGADKARAIFQHGRPPQGIASASLRVVRGTLRNLPVRTDPLRQRCGADGGPPHAACGVRTTRGCDFRVCGGLGRAPDASSQEERNEPGRRRSAASHRVADSPARIDGSPHVRPIAADHSQAREQLASRSRRRPNKARSTTATRPSCIALTPNSETWNDAVTFSSCANARRGLLIVAAKSGSDDEAEMSGRAQAQIDGSWALQILSGEMSPLAALDRRLGRPGPRAVENIRSIVGGRSVRRMDARVERQCSTDCRVTLDDYHAASHSDVIRAH